MQSAKLIALAVSALATTPCPTYSYTPGKGKSLSWKEIANIPLNDIGSIQGNTDSDAIWATFASN